MRKLRENILFIGSILSNWKYLLIFLFTSLIGFFVMYKFTMSTVANKSLQIFIMMSGVNYTFLDLFLTSIIALLFGVFVVLFVRKIVLIRQMSKVGLLGTLGLAVGLFSMGCPTCGALLFSLIGMPLALMYLPFGGLELKALSIVFLLLSNYLIVKGMTSCKIKIKRRKNGK